MDKNRIKEIKELLNSVPKGPWHFYEGSDFDHWALWSSHEKDGCHMVQDDSGVPPDPDFINYVVKSREIIEELLNEIEAIEARRLFDELLKENYDCWVKGIEQGKRILMESGDGRDLS